MKLCGKNQQDNEKKDTAIGTKTRIPYSFNKVRKLLQKIKGNISDDIIKDRDDRI
ncbi:Uncharacterized protein dnl_06440 [Desulfonema limicola]|uniref:Uncharacterized protein n=1 Tax=Desulfonema limicola TaxID=45656 RepID=A0A975B440_9BACT|nr:hypothetical protein [Desulfonema limicola]QTA78423.1 Uncharacterized protein dnl_06440 [Desulfonema limicola]